MKIAVSLIGWFDSLSCFISFYFSIISFFFFLIQNAKDFEVGSCLEKFKLEYLDNFIRFVVLRIYFVRIYGSGYFD